MKSDWDVVGGWDVLDQNQRATHGSKTPEMARTQKFRNSNEETKSHETGPHRNNVHVVE